MPRLWTDTIAGHKRAVRDATLDATAALVAEHGPGSLTMTQIAEAAGVGRATLYKYFADVEAVLAAWHERQITRHLEHLARIRDGSGSPGERLTAVLEAYARHSSHDHGDAAAAVLHSGGHVARARQRLRDFVRDLIAEAAASGELRDDVAPAELAAYCLHALTAARELGSPAAVRRLVAVTVDGLRPRR